MKNLRIVFMGTPEFAVTILDGIIKSGNKVCAIITAPDKPAGRGRKISESAVKRYATSESIPILQPTNLKDENFQNELKAINANLFVVVAFRMLPESVWSMPKLGTINLHASLLPQYRGAAPINWAIINGEKETGVTTFFIEKNIDTGNIIRQERLPIPLDMTAGQLHDELSTLGTMAVLKTLDDLKKDQVTITKQKDIKLNIRLHAPKIFKADCEINWDLPAIDVHNFIRGLSPYPGPWCKIEFKGKILLCKIFNSEIKSLKVDKRKKVLSNSEEFLFPCKDFHIGIREIQIEGKKRMLFKDFIAGNSIDDLKLLSNSQE